MRFKIFKALSIIFSLFISISAFLGGICMLIKPDGSILQMEELLIYFQVLPFANVLFQNYIFSGISLIIVNGLTNLVASLFALKNKRIGFTLISIFGITLMLWISIQFYIFPVNYFDIIYFIFGFFQLIIGFIALVSFNQLYFKFDVNDYKNINKKSDCLVVYFSRKGFSKKIAYEVADKNCANIIEIKTKERTEGDLGFWWCGRFAMHQWPMETFDLNIDLNSYKKVIIVSPIWVFKMCCPIRDFINKNKGILKDKELIVYFNHFNPWLPRGAKKEINSLLKEDILFISLTTMLGHTFKFKNK